MALIKKVSELLKEPISGFTKLDSGWYIVKRENQPESKRYSIGKFKSLSGIRITIHDFRDDENISFTSTELAKELDTFAKEETKNKVILEHKETTDLYEKGSKKDNGYLKSKKLDVFDTSLIKARTVVSKGEDTLLIPYTTFDLFPKFVGGKLISPTGSKYCVKGSTMKGSFHAHSYNEKYEMYFLGEGYAECFIASNLLSEVNVLEVGACSNMKNILSQIPEDKTVYLLGENDSKSMYNKLYEEFKSRGNITLVYPPDEKCKDFGDYFEAYGIDKTKVSLLGGDFKQDTGFYKPLGIQNAKPMVYSKILKDLVEINPNNLEDTLRYCDDVKNIHLLDLTSKRAFVNKIFLECAQLGPLSNDNKLPIGLWKNKDNKYYYNDGQKLLLVEKESLKVVPFEAVTNSDFLLCKVSGFRPMNISKEFTKKKELVDLISLCDWENDYASPLIIGFLAQSYYAGVHNFRPHLWLNSKDPHSGKSWLSSWMKTNLVKPSFGRESGKSSPAGTTQGMQNLAGLLFCDEIGESGSSFKRDNAQMIEILRSAATATDPIILGSPEQVPKKLSIRFSTLLSCIDGKDALREQDFARIIFVNFGKKKGRFEDKSLPKFETFAEEGHGEGFSSHIIKGFYMFNPLYKKYLSKLANEYPEIRHKARGLASCIAGYGVFMRDELEAEKLYKMVKGTDLTEGFEVYEETEDIVDQVMRTLINSNDVGGLVNEGNKVLADILREDGSFGNFGIMYEDKKLTLFTNMFRNFIEKYKQRHSVYRVMNQLRNSKYFLKDSNSTINGKRSRTLVFDYEI